MRVVTGEHGKAFERQQREHLIRVGVVVVGLQLGEAICGGGDLRRGHWNALLREIGSAFAARRHGRAGVPRSRGLVRRRSALIGTPLRSYARGTAADASQPVLWTTDRKTVSLLGPRGYSVEFQSKRRDGLPVGANLWPERGTRNSHLQPPLRWPPRQLSRMPPNGFRSRNPWSPARRSMTARIWRRGSVCISRSRTLEQGCASLKTGDKLQLDGELQSTGVVKFWRPVCPHGCLPSMTPVYAPLPSRAGIYFRGTTPPKGWR